MTKDNRQADLNLDNLDVDSLDDASRRALLGRIARAGAAVIPVSAVMLNSKAMAQSAGTSAEAGGF